MNQSLSLGILFVLIIKSGSSRRHSGQLGLVRYTTQGTIRISCESKSIIGSFTRSLGINDLSSLDIW